MREHLVRPEHTHTRPLSDQYSVKKINSFTTNTSEENKAAIPSTSASKSPTQLKTQEEEMPLQGKFEGRLVSVDPTSTMPIQRKYIGANEEQSIQKKEIPRFPLQKKENKTGLPDSLKAGVEHLSGMDFSDVKVHHNSGKPSEVNALAYAQGNDIHLSPGEEKQLPHEAWHVAQQRQGRVKPTLQMKQGTSVNDDAALESEADRMGAEASRFDPQKSIGNQKVNYRNNQVNQSSPIQRMVNENQLGGEDKKKYQALVLKVQEHNKDCPSHTLQFININNKDVTTLKQLTEAVRIAISTAKKKAAASQSGPDISQADDSSLTAFKPKMKEEAVAPKPMAKVPKASAALTEKEKLEQSIMSTVGSGGTKTVQREDFTCDITNLEIQTFVSNPKPANVQVMMGNHTKINDNTIYFPISIVQTISPTKTNTYNFVIHYHPNKTGNWLHAKRTDAAIADAQIFSAVHWMIDLPKLQAARTAWNFMYTAVAPVLP
jgi:hypothetical protein